MGNIVIGQSGGPTAVINSSLAGAIKCARINGIDQIYGMHHGIQGFLQDDLVDMDDYIGNLNDLSLLKRTPSAFLGSCRYKLPEIEGNEVVYEKIFEIMERHDIEYFLYIGGNDSMDTIKMLSDYAADKGYTQKFIGVPKTIDNDLPVTDHTPGYGSAAKFIATTTKEIIRDNESFGSARPSIDIIEIMGRNAGWLTAASALANDADCKGPDLIYLPEIPFDLERFTRQVSAMAQTRSSIVIAVSEGLYLKDGTLVCELGDYTGAVDAFGHKTLTGCGKVLANMIARETGIKTRAIEFSVLQRCATHMASRVDVDEAYNSGYVACEAAMEGKTGMMVTIKVVSREPYLVQYDLADIHGIANYEKKMPLDWICDNGTYVTDDFIEYAKPLIIGTLTPYYAGGLPKHMTLNPKY